MSAPAQTPARHARPPHAQGGLARAAARLRHPAPHWPDLAAARSSSSREHCIRRCSASSVRACSSPSGAPRKTIAAPSSTSSRCQGGNGLARKRRAGIGSRPPSRSRWARSRRAHEASSRISTRWHSAFSIATRSSASSTTSYARTSPIAPTTCERAGLDRAAAERQARLEFGGHARFKEEARDALAGGLLETLSRDLRFSVRQLRKSPSFSIAAVVTLAVAIGANAVVFGAINGFILRPLGLPHEETLFTIERASDHLPGESYPNYVDLRDRVRGFDGLAAFIANQAWFDAGSGSPTRAWVYEVERQLLRRTRHPPVSGPLLPCLGRAWTGKRARTSCSRMRTGARTSSADRDVIGRTVELSRHPFTIIGVAPPRFHGTVLVYSTDFFVPLVEQPQVDGTTPVGRAR